MRGRPCTRLTARRGMGARTHYTGAYCAAVLIISFSVAHSFNPFLCPFYSSELSLGCAFRNPRNNWSGSPGPCTRPSFAGSLVCYFTYSTLDTRNAVRALNSGLQQENSPGAGCRGVRCPCLCCWCCMCVRALMLVRRRRSVLSVCRINAKPLGGIWFSGDVHRMNQPELSLASPCTRF